MAVRVKEQVGHLAVIFINLLCLARHSGPAQHVCLCVKVCSLIYCAGVPVCQVAAVLASKTERAVLLSCESRQFTRNGECCIECPPGEGVLEKCDVTQTVCTQCLDSEYCITVIIIVHAIKNE